MAAAAKHLSKEKQDKARLIAARAITEVVFEGAFIGEAINRHLAPSELSAEHRAFATALVFGTITYWQTLTYYLEEVSHERLDTMSKYLQAVLALGVFQLFYADSVPAYAAVDTTVELAAYFEGKKVRPLANALLRQLTRQRPQLPKRAPGLAYGWSNELFGIVRASYGEAVAEKIAAFSTTFQKETSVRLNRKRVISELPERSLDPHIDVTAGRFVDTARRLLLKGRSPLEQAAFREGLMSLQNESSQLAVRLALQHKPESILDLCAGNGGKTAAFREGAASDVAITAVEIDPVKVERNRENLERLGLSDVRLLTGDATKTIPELAASSFDLVFCDVPCSGFGVLHKKPEIRLRMNYERIVELTLLQKAILQRAATYVRPGGHLFYVTCTHNRMENEEQIDAFLSANDSFAAEPFVSLPSELESGTDAGRLNLFAYEHGVDGLFIQSLRRLR